jgi:hypothetical protein
MQLHFVRYNLTSRRALAVAYGPGPRPSFVLVSSTANMLVHSDYDTGVVWLSGTPKTEQTFPTLDAAAMWMIHNQTRFI